MYKMTCVVCQTRPIEHRYKRMCRECYKEHSLKYHREYRSRNPKKRVVTQEKIVEYRESSKLRGKIKGFLEGKLTRYNHCSWPNKTCNCCGSEKDRGEFYSDSKSKDGKGYRCKDCQNEKTKLYRVNNYDWSKAVSCRWPKGERRSYYIPKPKREPLQCKYCGSGAGIKVPICHQCREALKGSVIKNFFSGTPSHYQYCSWPSKVCYICKEEQNRDSFHAQSGTKDGKMGKCKSCEKEGVLRRKHDKRQVVPEWLPKTERRRLSSFYRNRPEGFHVDHIVPLRGKTVSGLHVPWNLQYLSPEENMSKSNRWWPDMW